MGKIARLRSRQRWVTKALGKAVCLVVLCICLGAPRVWGSGAFGPGPNLLPDPCLCVDADGDGSPDGWTPGPGRRIQGVRPGATSWLRPREGHPGALVVTGGEDGAGYWETWAEGVRADTEYRLEILVYRTEFRQGVYPEVEIFGRRMRLDQNCTVREYQGISLDLPSGQWSGRVRLRLLVEEPGATFLFALPVLRERPRGPSVAPFPLLPADPGEGFPIGLYGAEIDSLGRIKEAGFNAVQSYRSEAGFAVEFLRECRGLGLGCLLTPPWDPEKVGPFLQVLEKEGALGDGQRVWFYLNDEPELRSVPPEVIGKVREMVLGAYPGRRSATAMVRPHMIPVYKDSLEIFMMDQYPVPHMPLTWLSDSIDEAVSLLGMERVWGVIQAFGGGRHALEGWTRRPTREEMRALSFLAVAHGARGLFFFSYPEVAGDPRAWEDLKGVVADLRKAGGWLDVPNVMGAPLWGVEMLSPFRADARGRPAIHLGVKARPVSWRKRAFSFPVAEEFLAIAVNVTEREVEGRIHGWPRNVERVLDLMSQRALAVVEGSVRVSLTPYGVAVLQGGPGDGRGR